MIYKKNYFKIMSWAFLLQGPLWLYGYGDFSLGNIITIIMLIIIFFKNGIIKVAYPKGVIFFLLYMVFTRVLFATKISEFVSFGFIFFILSIGIYSFYIDFKYTIKVYRIIAYSAIVFCLFQEMLFLTNGYRPSGLMEFLPYRYDSNVSFAILRNGMRYLDRVNSFFSEPAAFAQFLLPLLIIELFLSKNKYRLPKVIFISFTLILIRSGNGFFGLLCVFALWFINEVFRKKIKNKKKIIAIVFLIFLIFPYYATTSNYKNIVNRKAEVFTPRGSDHHSGFIRTYRGYLLINKLDIFHKIVGINNPTRIKGLIKGSGELNFKENDTYLNTIQTILLNGGVIGLILSLYFFKSYYKRKSKISRTLIITFLALGFIASLYLLPVMLIFLVLSFSNDFCDEKNNMKSVSILNFRIYYT